MRQADHVHRHHDFLGELFLVSIGVLVIVIVVLVFTQIAR